MTVNRCGHVVWWRVGKLERQAHKSAHLSKRHQDLEGGVHKEVGRLDNECEHGQVVQATLVLDRKEKRRLEAQPGAPPAYQPMPSDAKACTCRGEMCSDIKRQVKGSRVLRIRQPWRVVGNITDCARRQAFA